MHYAVEVFFVQDLVLVLLQYSQNQRVEEDPFVLEKLVEEKAHVLTRYDRGKEPKDPLTSVHLSANVVFY